MTLQTAFKIVVVIFTAANLAAMGLELSLRESIKTLRSARAVGLTIAWGWVVGPVLAFLVTRVVPLTAPHAAGLLLISLAPTAPFFPLMVRRARGDMAFAAAFMLLSTLGTVALLPILAPVFIKGLTVNAWSLAKPLLTMVLLPLMIGAAIRLYAAPVVPKLFPVVKRVGGIFLLICLALTLVLYGRDMLAAVGSFAIGAQLLFLIGITLVSYRIGFGLKQRQRSAMSLGMCTRNIAAVFAAYFGIASPPPGLFVMIVLVVPLALVVALIAARVFAARADLAPVGDAT